VTLGLLGAWPFLSFADHNRDDLPIYGVSIAIYGFVFVVALFAVAGLCLVILGRRHSVSVAYTLAIGSVCLFSYLAVAGPLAELGVALGSARIAVWLAGSLTLMTLTWLLSGRPGAALVLGVAAATMVVFPASRLTAVAAVRSGPPVAARMVPAVWVGAQQPSVYWLVLDAYGRADVLKAYFGFNNDGFLAELRERRFQVADSAFANYASTKLSISTTGNMDYFLPVGDAMHPLLWTARLQGFNLVADRFIAKGYRYVHVEPGGNNLKTRCGGREDQCITSELGGTLGLNEAEAGLLKLTALFPIVRQLFPDFLSFDFTYLSDVSNKLVTSPPMFVFIHILSPHTPPRYNADCSRIDRVAFDLMGDTWESYVTDLGCLNPEVIAFVDGVLAADGGDPIIIVQSDHGYRGDESGLPATAEAIDPRLVRFAVLQAIRLPEKCAGAVPLETTLVNTFRLVFTCMGDTDVPLIADNIYAHDKRTTWPLEIDNWERHR